MKEWSTVTGRFARTATGFDPRRKPAHPAGVMASLARILAAAVWSGLALTSSVRAEPAGLAQESPFLPTGIPASVVASGDVHEFAGVSIMGRQTSVNIYDKNGKKGLWIAVGETVNGITVAKYDSARELVTIKVAGAEKILALRKPAAAAARPGTVAPAPLPAGFNAPPVPTVAPAPLASAPANPTGVASPNAAVPAESALPTTPRPPSPAPGSVAHQEQEARMLVSDLLEIGMAQRKAYEEAQKKAAQSGGDGAAAAPPPATN